MSFQNKNSEYIFVKGKVSWVRYITPDLQFNKWSVRLHPDEESLKILQTLQMDKAIKNQFKKDEDGYYMQFSRPTERKIKGKTIAMTPPVVLDKDGQPMQDTAIGNGSDGIVKLEIYQHPTPTGGKAYAARWDSLRIDNLIPFNKDTDFPDPAMRDQVEGMDKQEPMF
jgi:hypothetical protein